MTGNIGESRRITNANKIHTTVTPLSDLKFETDQFSWKLIEDGKDIPKITCITSIGGDPWELKKSKTIVVGGRNLKFNAAYGDTVTVSWGEGDAARTISLTPTNSEYPNMFFDWPTELDSVPVGTKLNFVLSTCASIEGGTVYTIIRELTLA